MVKPMEVPEEERPSNTLELFVELPEVLELIAGLPVAIQTGNQFEKSYEIFSERLSRYQEQPHLLDPHLDVLLSNLLVYVRDDRSPAPLYHGAFKYLYQLSKVRTFKVLVKCLPHEITDLDFVLGKLEQEIRDDVGEHWESRYVLLMWMSILVMNPFQMSRLDAFESSSVECGDELTKAERIFRVCQASSNSNDTCSSVAAYLVSKHLVRIDIKDEYLPRFFDWVIGENPTDSSRLKTGQLAAIASILKHGKREDLLVHTERLLRWVVGCDYKELSDYLKSKLFIKIVQRLGLVMLKPRLAQWRYQRGQRSLTKNLAESGAELDAAAQGDTAIADEDDVDIQVPDSIEDVIEELLQSLRSPSSAIRWSAAKGIGRVTNRLPKALGDEVVGSVIEILHPLEPHEAWHGGCLAVAELSKRGLLLPYRLEAMVPNLQHALIYDEMKGYMSVGQHIRDAACYVAWAFARAYEPSVLQPFVDRIAAGLLVTTVFDREINCRRAASAAFQESVGRLGTFAHGIDILTAADFYTVGVRTNSYLNISDFVAQFVEYRRPLIDHLIEHKINHWDTAIRELTAKTMFKLTVRDPTYMATQVLPTLFEKTNSIDVNLRHGAVLSIGEIVRSLKKLQDDEPSVVYLTPLLISTVNELLLKFLKRDQFRGLSGDIMKMCCCDFIRNCSLADLPTNKECIESWQTIIDGCITKKSAPMREIAIAALAELAQTYYQSCPVEQNNALVQRYMSDSDDSMEENIRMGCVSALGALPQFMLTPCFKEVMRTLIRHSLKVQAEQMTNIWAESRRDAVKAISNLVARFGFEDAGCLGALDDVFGCLLQAQLEYTVDDRGDIGAWVREAAMNALYILLTTCPAHLLKSETVLSVMVGFAQQAVEIIDRTRGLAGNLFWKLVYHEPIIPHIPSHEALREIFPADTSDVLWIYADHTFPMFCAMLVLPEFSPRIILGISASMGKLSESLVKHSSTALCTFLRGHPQHVPRICEEILTVFAANLQNDPISHPFLNFLDSLLASGTIDSILLDPENPFADEIFRLVKLETKSQKKLYKLVSSINVLCQLIQVPRLCTKVLATLAVYLGLTHVHVRKCTATKLYEAIVIHADSCSIPEENVDEILEVLSETDWGLPLSEVRPIRNNLCTLMGIKAPVSLVATTPS